MNWKKLLTKTSISLLVAACFVIFVAFDTIAKQALLQPISLSAYENDSQVVPVGYDQSCDDACQNKPRNQYKAICCPKAVTKEVKKYCWKVTPEIVCIPDFRWPWEPRAGKNPKCGDSCANDCQNHKPRSGRVRCVNVLEKHEYTCNECGYEWVAKRVCNGGCSCDSKAGGSCPECGHASCD